MRSHTLLCLALVLMLAACEPTGRPIQKTRQPSMVASVMHWETNGGGQITFSVTRNRQAYDGLVTSYQFKAREDRFTISAESGAVYQALSRVMQDQGSIGWYDPAGPPRGSWTTLGFSDGTRSSIYKDAIVTTYRDLQMIYDYVAAQVERE